MDIKVMNEDKIKNLEAGISFIRKGFSNVKRLTPIPVQQREFIVYHYTSIKKLFRILNGDSMWASRSRFSNDTTEDQVLGNKWLDRNQYYGDNYILCFCQQDDVLSQWRGYCPSGGASIGINFQNRYDTYTLLHSDYQENSTLSGEWIESYRNRPLPVIYCQPQTACKTVSGVNTEDLFMLLKDPEMKKVNLDISDLVPYLKNGFFYEEQELRLVFVNSNNALEKCIRFREQQDGSLIPYIIVKFGNQLEMGRRLSLTYTKEKIREIFEENVTGVHRKTITIPCGIDQADVCAQFTKLFQNYQKKIFGNKEKWKRWQENPGKILCDGHLPIVSITVAPSPRQEQMREIIERFCKSRYWLQNVKVKCSEIPYIAPKL